MNFQEWLENVDSYDVAQFLQFCHENRVFPGDTSLENYYSSLDKKKELLDCSKLINGNQNTIYEALLHLDNTLNSIQSLDDTGDAGFDLITTEVSDAQNWLFALKERTRK